MTVIINLKWLCPAEYECGYEELTTVKYSIEPRCDCGRPMYPRWFIYIEI